MENKVQLKTGDKIKIPTRKSLGDDLTFTNNCLRGKEYAYIGNKYTNEDAYYVCARLGGTGYGKFKLQDFDLYEEPTKFKVGDRVNPPTSKNMGETFVGYTNTLKDNRSGNAAYGIVAKIEDSYYIVDIYDRFNSCIYHRGLFKEIDLTTYEEKAPEVTNERFFNIATGPRGHDELTQMLSDYMLKGIDLETDADPLLADGRPTGDGIFNQMQHKNVIAWDSSTDTKETKFKVGDLVEVPTTKSRGVMSLGTFLNGFKDAVCGKITSIDAFDDYYYVELLNKDDVSLGGARFAKEDLVLKTIYDAKKLSSLEKAANFGKAYGAPVSSLKQTTRTVKPDDVDLPEGGTSFDIILDEDYKSLPWEDNTNKQVITPKDISDVFLASRGYGKSLAMWNELNNIHQQRENNKNALTILALRS